MELSGARLLLIGCMALLATGCVSYQARNERTVQALMAAADADSLAAAAMLLVGPEADPAARLALIGRAADQAPDRPDIVWLAIRLCTPVASCDSEAREAQLRALDPENGAAWFDAIGRARQRDDAPALRQALMSVAAATRFDLYWNAIVVHMTQAIVKTHAMDLPSAYVVTNGVAAALAIPAYQPLLNACRGEGLREPDAVAICRQAAAVMRHGDTYISEIAGAAVARKVWPEGSAEFSEAVAARRAAHYQLALVGQIERGRLASAAYVAQRLRLMTEHSTEQAAAAAQISAAGLSLQPPADWTDPYAAS